MPIPSDSISLDNSQQQQQSNGIPSDSIPLNGSTVQNSNGSTMTIGNQITQQPNYTNSMLGVNPLLNQGLASQLAGNEASAKIQPEQTQNLGQKAGEEILSGATAIAKDAELGDLMTSALRMRVENYAQAYKGGALGSVYDNLRGSLGQHPITKTLAGNVDPDAISARSAFESSTNGLLSQGQQVFAGQMGTGTASTRIMSTVLDLLKGEFGGPGDSPASMIGRTEGSQQTIYLIQKFGGQYLDTLNKMGITPSNIDNLPPSAIDQIKSGFSQAVHQGINNYEVTPEDRAIINARADYINEPLKELQNKGKSSSVDYKDLLNDIK
jgi:hypothetical protein